MCACARVRVCVWVTRQHGECGGLPGAVVSQQHRDLSLKHVQGQVSHGLTGLIAQLEFLQINSVKLGLNDYDKYDNCDYFCRYYYCDYSLRLTDYRFKMANVATTSH